MKWSVVVFLGGFCLSCSTDRSMSKVSSEENKISAQDQSDLAALRERWDGTYAISELSCSDFFDKAIDCFEGANRTKIKTYTSGGELYFLIRIEDTKGNKLKDMLWINESRDDDYGTIRSRIKVSPQDVSLTTIRKPYDFQTFGDRIYSENKAEITKRTDGQIDIDYTYTWAEAYGRGGRTKIKLSLKPLASI